jgi:hypothetical protein
VSVNPYLKEVHANLPRLLALFDSDRTSASYGMGDRYHWAWGLIDFPNATFQGAAHGLARLWAAQLWPYQTDSEIFIKRIDAIFKATFRLARADGSLEEAFPREGSYCVTALVAFDLLCALEILSPAIDEQQRESWKKCVEPLIRYLCAADETHALISNHLATAATALARWHGLTSDGPAERKAQQLLNRILKNQSAEGWFKEYEGADPGYQSLCTYYLADLHKIRPDLNLLEPLQRSLEFLEYFAHPDGSFGGVYGSRCTRFYYPSGVSLLANEVDAGARLSRFMASAVKNKKSVSLSAIDEPNLVPMFNSYVWAAVLEKDMQDDVLQVVPALSPAPFRKRFNEAGLLVDRGSSHYSIVSTHKGGVVYHFKNDAAVEIDAGVVVSDRRGRLGSTQGYCPSNQFSLKNGLLEVTSAVSTMPKQLPNTFQFITLRTMSLTVFRSPALREWVKRLLVKRLITKRVVWPITNRRQIVFGQDLKIQDFQDLPRGYRVISNPGPFVPIHMASQGYWQMQDEQQR